MILIRNTQITKSLRVIDIRYECLGRLEQAMSYYEKCGDYAQAKERIAVLEKQEGQVL